MMKGKTSRGQKRSRGKGKSVRSRKEAARLTEILRRLSEAYPEATCALFHQNAFQLLVATILSAQCTDARVNMVTPRLFEVYPDPASLAAADEEELQEIIRSTGFFRNKSKNLIGASQVLVSDFRSVVPETMEELLRLPGVARKTANVVLGNAHGIASGVVVDTHVSRISQRLELTHEKDPVKIERDLMERVPREEWIDFSHRLIHHGRKVCQARKPRCQECPVQDLCPWPVSPEDASE